MDGVVLILLKFNLFMDSVVRFGINSCLWTLLSLADGSVCIFFSILIEGVVRILLYLTLFTDGFVRFEINICLWTVSSLTDHAVYIYCFHFQRMVSSIFYSSVAYLRMVSFVLELIIVCGRCRLWQMMPSAYFFCI